MRITFIRAVGAECVFIVSYSFIRNIKAITIQQVKKQPMAYVRIPRTPCTLNDSKIVPLQIERDAPWCLDRERMPIKCGRSKFY